MQTIISEAIRERSLRLQRAEYDLVFRQHAIEACRLDPVLWCNHWVWTTDPRNAARGLPINVPFLLWEKQEEYLRWRRGCQRDRKFGIIAKSRDSGVSWLNSVDQVHHLLFDQNYKGAIGSRKESLIDKLGDPDTLFQKMRFILEALPHWMKPATSDFTDTYMRFINSDRGNVITGEAGSNIGRGGRNGLYDVDEFAFLERQSIVLAALSQNTDTIILTSTPNGNSNEFAKIFQGDNEGFSRFQFLWKDDPRKNHWIVLTTGESGKGWDAPVGSVYPWYEEQKTKLDPLTIAQEIDCDFSASQEGICIPAKWVNAAINFPMVMRNYNLQAGLDVATEGNDKSVLIVIDGDCKVTVIDEWKGYDTTQTAYKARDLCHQYDVDHLNLDADGVGAGVSGTLKSIEYGGNYQIRFTWHPFHGGGSPSDKFWEGEQKFSKDKFANSRAEMWYELRERFRKTHETREGIRSYPVEECISIPHHQQLISELSMPLMKYRDNGKILIESKADMKKRGCKSPDYADALVYALYHPPLIGNTNSVFQYS